jgi:lysophospholipase L1-like esterase
VTRLAALAGVLAALLVGPSCASPRVVRATDARVAVMGRVDRGRADRLRFGYPGVTLRLRFLGASLAMRAGSTTGDSRLDVSVDGGPPRALRLPRGAAEVALFAGLGPGPHAVDLIHRTETWQGIVTVWGFDLGPGGHLLPPEPRPARRLLFIGDSVTCGEAADRVAETNCDGPKRPPAETSNGALSYGVVLGRALGAEVHLVCYGGRGLIRDWRGRRDVLNAPQILDLAVPADAPSERAPWDPASYTPDGVVVSLGTNDFNLGLGALPAREELVPAYVAFVRAIRARHPRAHVFLTEGAIVNDDTDPSRPQKTVLRSYLDDTARRLGDPAVHVVPAARYPGDACNPHPTREQHAAIARDLDPVVRTALGW